MFETVMMAGGFLFLLYMGWVNWNSRPNTSQNEKHTFTPKKQAAFAAAVSLLNPHAILDTIGVIGTSSLQYSGLEKWLFMAACIAVSWIWFISLAIAGRLFQTIDTSGRLMLIVNKCSAAVMGSGRIFGGVTLLQLKEKRMKTTNFLEKEAMLMTDAKQFYDYHSWANKKIFTHIENLPEKTAYQEVKSVFPSVSDVLLHMCRADYIWLNVLSGVAYQEIIDSAGKLESAHGNMAAIKQLAADLESQYHDFFSRQTDLEQTFTMQHPKLGTLESTYADTILHVVNHGTYHRGNVTAMLRQLGHSGVPTDYMYYLYEKRESKG